MRQAQKTRNHPKLRCQETRLRSTRSTCAVSRTSHIVKTNACTQITLGGGGSCLTKPGKSTPKPAIIPTHNMLSHAADGTRSSLEAQVPRRCNRCLEGVTAGAVAMITSGGSLLADCQIPVSRSMKLERESGAGRRVNPR